MFYDNNLISIKCASLVPALPDTFHGKFCMGDQANSDMLGAVSELLGDERNPQAIFISVCELQLTTVENTLLKMTLSCFRQQQMNEAGADQCILYILKEHSDLMNMYEIIMENSQCRNNV